MCFPSRKRASPRLKFPGLVDIDDASARGVFSCPKHVYPTRRSSGVSWSSWSEPDVIRPTWLVSLSLPPRRSATGSRRPTGRKAGGSRNPLQLTSPWLWASARNWRGCGGRTSSCAWSATSSLERQPGSPAKPEQCRPGLRVHERKPVRFPHQCHGTRTRRVDGRLPRLAPPPLVRSC